MIYRDRLWRCPWGTWHRVPAGAVLCLLLWGLAQGLAGPGVAAEAWPPLARIGPWPVLSQPIAFDGRLWFVNSVKGRNHNSADIYSFDPASAEARYERHLFSQDAGAPVVHGGRLFWPFEDSRFSLGWGHYLTTDGQRWRMGTIPSTQIFHVHAIAEADGQVFAATSAWRAGLQASHDGGSNWRPIYDHPTATGRVSRFVDLVTLNSAVFAHLIESGVSSLVRVEAAGATAVPGWPLGRRILSLITHREAVLGVVREAAGNRLWRSDGRASESLAVPEGAHALARDGETLWLLAGNAVWSRTGGGEWRHHADLQGGTPWQIAILAGQPYVTGAGDDGQGALWGPDSVPVSASSTGSGPVTGTSRTAALMAPELAARLDRALAAPASYERHAPIIRDLVYAVARSQAPAHFLHERLSYRAPELTLSLIGGNVRVEAAEFGRWILLWGMAVAERGRVPLDLLAAPWRAPENPSEKYFDIAPAAMWAVAAIGQRDRGTIEALVERLARNGDPLWLRGDVVGALTALTGHRFGYEIHAWNDWWTDARAGWSD